MEGAAPPAASLAGDSLPMDVSSVHHHGALLRYSVSLLGYGFYGDIVKDSEKKRWMGLIRYDFSGNWRVGDLVGTAPREAGAPVTDGPRCPGAALLLSGHGAGAMGTAVPPRLHGVTVRGSGTARTHCGPQASCSCPAGRPPPDAGQSPAVRSGGRVGAQPARRLRPASACCGHTLPERLWVAPLPWSSSRVLTRCQNRRDELGARAGAAGTTDSLGGAERALVGCPERGSAPRTHPAPEAPAPPASPGPHHRSTRPWWQLSH